MMAKTDEIPNPRIQSQTVAPINTLARHEKYPCNADRDSLSRKSDSDRIEQLLEISFVWGFDA